MTWVPPPYIQKRRDQITKALEFIANGPTFWIGSRANTKRKDGNGYEKFQWCRDCIGEQGIAWVYNSKRFYFRNEGDLLLFKLRWKNRLGSCS